jgi:uncharacterized protein (DUF1501 family)
MINRRDFIKITGVAAASLALHKLQGEEKILASVSGKVLVPVFLRGGMDGMSLIVPYNDPRYYEIRKSTMVPKPGQNNGALDLDGFFGLNPRAKALLPLFENKCLTVLNGVGHSKNTRSHFTEQDIWETGNLKDYIRSDGIFNKYLSTSQNKTSILRGVSFGENLPRMMRGSAQTFSLRSIDDLFLGESSKTNTSNALESAYAMKTEQNPLIHKAGSDMLVGLKEIRQALGQDTETKIIYPNSTLGKQFKDAARLIKSKLGLEIIQIDVPGWDTHQNQGSVTGSFGNKIQEVADSLLAFYQDLENIMDNVLIVIFSEFGRTVVENGTNGTDHGWGNCMLALGGTIPKTKRENKYFLNTWPGLDDNKLNQGRDIKDTIDFRNVFGEILSKHLGYKEIKKIIPDFEFNFPGLIS